MSSSVVETVLSAVESASGASVTGAGLLSWLTGPLISSVGMLSVSSSIKSFSSSSNSGGRDDVDGL
jgi:hypothetical protein